MPKNTKGGKKFKKGKKKTKEDEQESKKIRFREDCEEYALITHVLGNGRFRGLCSDNVLRLLILRGKLRKGRFKQWVNRNDIVLASLRDFQGDKADIIHVYNEYHAKKLNILKELGAISEKLEMSANDDIFSIEEEENEHKDITIESI